MASNCPNPMPFEDATDWRKNRTLVRQGFKDLAYLPPGRSAWDATLAAHAFSARRQATGRADLNLWASMHGCPGSMRYERLGDDGLVLWHGTTAQRARKIRQFGLFHKRGVWAATEPAIAHGYTRGRGQAYRAGSAMIVLLVSKTRWESKATREGESIARFHESIPAECVEYILWGDRIEFVRSAQAEQPKPWGTARFKRQRGRWVPRSRPPVRFDGKHAYVDLAGWLELSIRRVLVTLGSAAAIEIFSSLYATIDPWAALEHRQVFAALEDLCDPPRTARGGIRLFALANSTSPE